MYNASYAQKALLHIHLFRKHHSNAVMPVHFAPFWSYNVSEFVLTLSLAPLVVS